jgi:hypothetical protein
MVKRSAKSLRKVSRRSRRKCGSRISKKSNPKLWESVKKKVLKGSKGGPVGKWSARKAQLSVMEYKKRGGKYIGKKSKCNSLQKWGKEDWGYVKGSNPKKHKGRYLPKKVRESLSKKERNIENKRKGSKRGKWIPYSKSVSKKMKKYKIY